MERSEGWRRTRDGGRAERASKNESRHSVRVHEAARRLALQNAVGMILWTAGGLGHADALSSAISISHAVYFATRTLPTGSAAGSHRSSKRAIERAPPPHSSPPPYSSWPSSAKRQPASASLFCEPSSVDGRIVPASEGAQARSASIFFYGARYGFGPP